LDTYSVGVHGLSVSAGVSFGLATVIAGVALVALGGVVLRKPFRVATSSSRSLSAGPSPLHPAPFRSSHLRRAR
jgi:hypothetical protein